MEENKGFDGGNIDACGGRFSQMMFASDEERPFGIGMSAEGGGVAGFNYLPSCFPVEKSPHMLCFGSYGNQTDHPFAETPIQKSGLTCSDSSSASSANTTLFKSSRKRSESDEEPCLGTVDGAYGAPSGGKGRLKKTKTRSSMSGGGGHTPLGERVTALQQLVSPYGKSDTASVLHEALGYIRFLHDQVLALCSPYLQPVPSCSSCNSVGDEKDLRSRGLCLVPVGCTARVPGSNGADFWSSARRNVSSYP